MATSAPSSRHSATFSSLPAVANTRAPACLRQLDRGRARTAGGGVDQHGLARLQRRRGRTGPSHARWNGKYSAAASGSGMSSGMSNVDTTGQIAYSAKPPMAILVRRRRPGGPASASAPVAARVDDAHDLHARAVRQLGPHHHVAAGDPLEVVEVERDRLHPHPHLAGLGLGDRHGRRAAAPRAGRRTRCTRHARMVPPGDPVIVPPCRARSSGRSCVPRRGRSALGGGAHAVDEPVDRVLVQVLEIRGGEVRQHVLPGGPVLGAQ